MNYIFLFMSIIISCMYFFIGVLFFKGSLDINFIEINKYVFYSTAVVAIIGSKFCKYINIKYLNEKINQGDKISEILQNFITFSSFSIFLINLVSLFWFIVFNFK